jgi:hypothetical protein
MQAAWEQSATVDRKPFQYPEPVHPAADIRRAIASLEQMTERNWETRRREAMALLGQAADRIETMIMRETGAAYAVR